MLFLFFTIVYSTSKKCLPVPLFLLQLWSQAINFGEQDMSKEYSFPCYLNLDPPNKIWSQRRFWRLWSFFPQIFKAYRTKTMKDVSRIINIDVNNSNMSMFVNHNKLYVTRYSILDCLSTSCIAGRKRLFDIYHLWPIWLKLRWIS